MKICVVGGGAAGMMAAIAAAERGLSVTLLEQNEKLGKKLYITGKGRCNVTNDCDEREFLQNVMRNPRFLYSAIYAFNSADVQRFFDENGTPLKVERGNRVFPASDKSSDIIRALARALERAGVQVELQCRVSKIEALSQGYCLHTTKGEWMADGVILACGGVSYPGTGSTGEGFRFARELGHTVTPLLPALVPIRCADADIAPLQGLSLKNVCLHAETNQGHFQQFGEMLFTSDGISGPIALTMASLVNQSTVRRLYIDCKPALSEEQLDHRLLRELDAHKNQQMKNILPSLLPKSLAMVLGNRLSISEKPANSITKEQRKQLLEGLKHFSLQFDGLYDIAAGIVTCGGVAVGEVNPKTMESKLHANLYFAGEMLDVDALTGGFNLQIAFSTGFLAGKQIGEERKKC